jgi:hypothetical protein
MAAVAVAHTAHAMNSSSAVAVFTGKLNWAPPLIYPADLRGLPASLSASKNTLTL